MIQIITNQFVSFVAVFFKPPPHFETSKTQNGSFFTGAAAVQQQNGYHQWIKTGITFTDNQDLSYIGLRQVGTDVDYTETVINWSDND